MDTSKYIGKVVEFTNKINQGESDFSPGCRGRIVSCSLEHEDVVHVLVDVSEFQEFNKHKWEANYWDADHNPTLKFIETRLYPKDHRVSDYWCPSDMEDGSLFKIIEDDTKEIQDTTDLIYWMMLQVIESKAKETDVLDRDLVNQAYKHWNRLHPVDPPVTPRWDRK